MSGFDGTGPVGGGPGTGRGLGVCGAARPMAYGLRGRGYYGRGMGLGAGRSSGWGACRWWAGAPAPYNGPVWSGPDDEKAFLEDQAARLKTELAEMEKRMADLD